MSAPERRTVEFGWAAWILGCSILGAVFACAQALCRIADVLEAMAAR